MRVNVPTEWHAAASLDVDRDYDRLRSPSARAALDQAGVPDRGRVEADLVRARIEERLDVRLGPDSAADGERGERHRRSPRDDVQHRAPSLRRSGDVEERDLVGPFRVVPTRVLRRIALVDEVDEVDSFDDPPVLDVEAGDDPRREHGVVPGS